MANEETTRERQEFELEALIAIYGEDIVDVREKRAWNLWQPLNIIIALSPLKGSSTPKEAHVSVSLHVICSEDYPNVAPKLLLENSKGMSKTVLNELQKNLEEKARNYVGEVMIFQLANYVEAFLHEHNKPGLESFYDEMLKRQQEKEREKQLARQKEREKEREGILNEFNKKQEILKLEHKKNKERYSSDSSNTEDISDVNTRRSSEVDSFSCDCKGTEIIEFSNNGFQEIQRGKCINHSTNKNSILYGGLDLETGDFYVISEWSIPFKNNNDIQISRQISSIEQECNYLVKLKHVNIVKYLNIKHVIEEDQNKVIVYVLREFACGLNCSSLFLNQNLPVDLDKIRHIATNVLNAIEFLHRNSVVHKEISLSNMYFCNEGIVKLSNHSLGKRLSDLAKTSQSQSSLNKKSDIFMFGLAMLSLFRGQVVSEEKVGLPTSVSLDFHDFLSRCLAKEEKERSTATQLLNHVFIRAPLEKFFPDHDRNDVTSPSEVPPQPFSSEFKLFNNTISSGPSRVETEFEVLMYIGKGAFGDVIKVRNKLDGGYYAIKRIELNPRSKQLNKKITREVKLLSKLNHENVVRYYNAWIESAVLQEETDRSNTSSDGTVFNVPKVVKPKELTFKNDVELLAPPIKSVEWSISYDSKSHANAADSSSSSDELSSEDPDWGFRLEIESESDSESVKFEGSSSGDKSTTTKNDASEPNAISTKETFQNSREIQFLYIQMEFCEKSTLRTAIDADLYNDMNRVWRLFREIVEGLAHIHQQGMIHRDLKPVNIFLDSNDHVKIGDFGLATTNLFCRQEIVGSKSLNDNEKSLPSMEDGSLTGQVGTALYTAPELSTATKTVYDQRVDIYSLGIIFFEMCYKPLKTQMERMKVLSSLRAAEIMLPIEFETKTHKKQASIIKWLLNHDVSQRPTSQELLQSDLIPAPVLEEEKLRDMFRHTLNNPQLKSYKFLIASCFDQTVTPAQDLTYDMDLPAVSSIKSLQVYELVKETVVKMFKLHGGQNIITPLLIPKSKYYETSESCVKLMTHAGSIVSLPHDLRVPFARYVAWNEITLLRRYSIDRVYREKRVFGFHPRELYECAFDIVNPVHDNLSSDGEVLHIVCSILEELPGLKNKNFIIRINHTLLLKAILLHCGIKEGHEDIYNVLSEAKESKSKNVQIKAHLLTLGLSDNSIATLFNLIELEQPLSKITSILQSITRKRSNEAAQLAKEALQDLKIIINHAESLGVSYNIIVTPGLAYNISQYSGMMCQFLGEFKKRKRHVYEVIAAGGRYDDMIRSYRNIKEQANTLNKDVEQHAVGISISLDKLVQAVQEEQDDETTILDAVVCSLGSKNFVNEKAQIVKDLWSAGIRASIIDALNIEEIQEICVDLNVSNLIILKEKGMARLQNWEKGKFQEKLVALSETVDTFLRSIRNVGENSFEQQSTTISRSESKVSNCDHLHDASVSIDFVTIEKLSSNTRKRYENQIRSQLDTTFKLFNGDVIVLATNLDATVIKSLSNLELDCEAAYQKTVNIIIERHQRHRTYIMEVCDEIYEYKSKNFNSIIILYSISNQMYKILF